MLQDHPVLTMLGRRGRGAVLDQMLADPDRTWSIRSLARAAQVPAATASRTVQELADLSAVDTLRPGRDAHVRFRAQSAVGRILLGLELEDVRDEAATRFVHAYGRPAGVRRIHRWLDLPDHPALPDCPTRIAILCGKDTETAFEAVGPALDAVRAAGYPVPDVTVWSFADLADDDPVAQAILQGEPL